ncbi:PIN-like domain-containing protein [Streptomyces cellulosae]
MLEGEVHGDGDGLANHRMLSHFPGWLTEVPYDRETFFKDALVLPDANVLLTLYDITADFREFMLAAFESEELQGRYWLTHQTLEEFARGRSSRVGSRLQAFSEVETQVTRAFKEVGKLILEARKRVQSFLDEYGRDPETAKELAAQINSENIEKLPQLREWRKALLEPVQQHREAYDIDPRSLSSDDPVLKRIAALFGANVGIPFPDEERHRLVRNAIDFRFPNKIPPGFADVKEKSTELLEAGDFLFWSEIIQKAKTLPHPRLVLLVTNDTKVDWCARKVPPVPLPGLRQELWQHAEAHLWMETTTSFLEGIGEFLGSPIPAEAAQEIAEALERQQEGETGQSQTHEITISAHSLPQEARLPEIRQPERELLQRAIKLAGFERDSTLQTLREQPTFANWLVAVVINLQPVEMGVEEHASIVPMTTVLIGPGAESPPRPDWRRTRLPVGAGIRNVWIAPWLLELIETLEPHDHLRLRKLAGRHLAWHTAAQ